MALTSPKAESQCPLAARHFSWDKLVFNDENTTQPVNNGDMTYVEGTGIRYKSEGTVYTLAATTGASKALDDLAAVAINTSLISDANNADDLGSDAKEWKDIWIDGVAYLDTVQTDLIQEDTSANGVVIDGVKCKDNGLIFSGDITVNTDKFTVTGANGNTLVAGTFEATGASTLTGNVGCAGTLTVDGTSTLTGNVACAGDLAVDGSFTFGGTLSINDTLTVDELILDTDGTAPGATNCYAVRDNSGDLTVNAITGKIFHVAIAGSDEYDFGAAALDMNANALNNCGYVILNAATAPANTEVYAVNDNTGDLTINALSTKAVHVAIAGTDEFNFTATEFEIASGNDIQFLGNDGILDSAGNEVILVEAVGSAVNYLLVKNAATANPIVLSCEGTADKGFQFENDQDEEILILTPVASAVNELTIKNAATGGQPIIQVSGEADKGLEIQNAAGEVLFETLSTADPLNWLSVSNSNTGVPVQFLNPGEDDVGFTFDAKNSEPILRLAATAAGVDYITITSAAAGGEPVISATGATANIDIVLTPKGTGLVAIGAGGLDMATLGVYGGTASGNDLLLASTEDATKGCVYTQALQEGFRIGSNAVRAGTAATNVLGILDGTAPQAGQALTDGIEFYSAGGEAFVIDAAGTATQLSPHNSKGEYVFNSYSTKTGKTLQINMERICKTLVKMFPDELKDLIKELRGASSLHGKVVV